MVDANLNQLWARALVEELARGGVEHAVICPGSRSAPLALACAGQLKTWSVIDERSAAFFALGIAKQSGRPVVVVATSGTAGAHFYPAVIEAAESHVPLILLTADRPVELRGWGAPQTIQQQELYGAFTRWFADLGAPEASAAVVAHLRATAARAVAAAQRAPRGPVHLNAPFRDPLVPIPDGVDLASVGALGASGRGGAPLVRFVVPSREPDLRALEAIRQRCLATARGVILCGPRDAQDGFREAVIALGQALGFPVLAEATSQVRFGASGPVLSSYDAILRHPPFATAHRPELILRFGGGLTSKTLQAWVDTSGAEGVTFSDDGGLFDPGHAAATVVEGDPVTACRFLSQGTVVREGSWASAFAEADRRARSAIETAFRGDALSEPRIAREVAASVPSGGALFVSSSMPIRDLDAFAFSSGAGRTLANRGVNGIDGITSTALGVAAAAKAPTTLLVGDLAFLHDLGGLLTAHRHRLSLSIVVVQNDGGGIFSFLPIARHPEHFEALFGTPHGLGLAHAAALFGGAYAAPSTASGLREALTLGAEGGLQVIEARVSRSDNPGIHQDLVARVADALGSGPWN